jgi:hypothetical protein
MAITRIWQSGAESGSWDQTAIDGAEILLESAGSF